jgi:hypothetical protein
MVSLRIIRLGHDSLERSLFECIRAERDSLERSLFRYIYAGRSSLERPLFGLIERDFLRMRYPQGYLSFSAMLWYVRLQP